MRRKCFLRYYGGKFRLIPKLLPLIPEHKIYCEVFSGGANLLFAKEPSKIEILNDIDSLIVNLYRVLRDPQKFEKFRLLLELTPYSREEYSYCKKLIKQDIECDDVEKARCFYVLYRQGFSGIGNSWSFAIKRNHASTYYKSIDNLTFFHNRIRNVQIENLDFEKCIKHYDSKYTFFYLDPPYLHEVRRDTNSYRFEMSREDHVRMLETVLSSKGKFLISGYDNDLYNDMLSEWGKTQWEVKCHSQRLRNSLREKRIETVWYNYQLDNYKLIEGEI